MSCGWYLAAFESELKSALDTKTVGSRKVLLVRGNDGSISAYDAICPHRGADLGHVGQLDGDRLLCSFHNYHVGLGKKTPDRFCVASYVTRVLGGLVFVRIGDGKDCGFGERLDDIESNLRVFPGFKAKIEVPHEYVIENAFDQTHFLHIHDVPHLTPFKSMDMPSGAFRAESVFTVPRSKWQTGGDANSSMVDVPFQATAYSPGLIISKMEGDNPYTIITGATPVSPVSTIVRLSIAVPVDSNGNHPHKKEVEYLFNQSRKGIGKDIVVWETLDYNAQQRYTEDDGPVVGFRKFCAQFLSVLERT